MRRCTLLANCQGHGVALYLKRLGFPYEVETFESYKFFYKMQTTEELERSLRRCDLFLCQPTKERFHFHQSSEFYAREMIPKTARVVQFPYVWNHGQHPLFPQPPPNFYHGYSEIKDRLTSASLDRVLSEYDHGTFNFHLSERFQACVEETRRRENEWNMEVTIADWMWAYRSSRLLISYNHPASVVHCELARRIFERATGQTRTCPILHYNEPGLPSELPLSDYVVRAFGMQEQAHPAARDLYRRMLADAHARANGDVGRPSVDTSPYVL